MAEDDRDVCEILKRTLEANDYVVWCVSSGAQALEVLAAKGLPDLAMLDVMMPGMDGLELGAKIQATTDLPIIMLSARSDSRT
ncbi:MAG: response regulator, partial [bacterium]|nr:response regulator [bacterium]